MVDPSIQFKTVERHALSTNRDFGDVRPDFDAEAVSVHAEVSGGVAEAQKPRGNGCGRCRFLVYDHSGVSAQGRQP